MTSVSDLLRDADPVGREAGIPDEAREQARRTTIAAASAETRPRSPARRALVVGAICAAVAIAAAVSKGGLGGGATLEAAVRVEVRLAETSPAPGLREAKVGDRTIYLHDEAVVTNDDIASARVVPQADGSAFDVALVLGADGAEKMRTATAAHMNRPMAILIDGQVVMAPTVRSVISDSARITGRFTRAEAERIANGVMIR